VVELEKLRRELAYRRQLNEQQNNMITQQRAQLTMGQDEMANIDHRIAELQDRLTRKRMMNQQLANQINAATSAKQAQLRAIQAGLSNKNKTKPVSTVEPFQRSMAPQQVDNHHVSAEDLKPGLSLQEESLTAGGNKNIDSKYQTLPYNTKFGHLNKAAKIEQLKQEKENNNIGFSEALPRPPPPVYGSRGQDYQGNYGQGIGVVAPLPPTDSSVTSAGTGSKPVSSVAPVYGQPRPGYATPTSSDSSPFSPNSKLSSTPLSLTPTGSRDQESPTKLRPALPPKPQHPGPNPVHGEDGTSVDDEDLPPPPPTSEPPNDSPTPENATSDRLNANNRSGDLSVEVGHTPAGLMDGSGLMVSAPAGDASTNLPNLHMSVNRRIEMPPSYHFPEDEAPPSDLISGAEYPMLPRDVTDNAALFPMVNQIYKEFQDLAFEEKEQLFNRSPEESDEYSPDNVPEFDPIPMPPANEVKGIIENIKRGLVKVTGQTRHNREVSFDPLALLLDASLEGELDLVKKTAGEVADPSAANDEGITALHNAICAGHLEIVQFLVLFGCDVNAQDSDGWTPLHCAASCNNLSMVRFLVEHGACIFATTLSDHETAAEKCEEDEEGFDGCSEYLYHIQEKLGIMNEGILYAVYAYDAEANDELTFHEGDSMMVLRKGDEVEKEWWWSRREGRQEDQAEGYIPRNLLGLYPRVPAPAAGREPMEE
jgi:apoptosis-stimulating of p53 protein 1